MANDIYELLKKYAKETTEKSKGILASNGKSDSRIYKKINFIVKKTSDGYVIENQTNLPGYAIFLDKGRKAGKQPPLLTIQQWCQRKNIDVKMAFPIARNIGKTGLPSTNFLQPFRDIIKKTNEMADKIAKEIKNNLEDKMK